MVILRSLPANFQSCATFVVGFFPIEVCSTTINGRFSTVNYVLWQAPNILLLLLWIFVVCRLSHHFRSVEFGRSCGRSCKLGSLLCLSPARWVRHNFEMASCSELSESAPKAMEQLFRLTVCRLIFPVRGVCVLGEKFYSSVSVGDRVVVRVEANWHAHSGFALSVHKEGTADVAGWIGKEVAEPLVPFIRIVDRFGIIIFFWKNSSTPRMSRNGLFLVHSEVISFPYGSSTWAKKEVLIRAPVLQHSSVEGTAVEDFVAAMKKAGCFEFKSVSFFF